ncbi:MAG: ABC transporter permease subunit [Bacteroidales bacterium]|nr:ABC transporter permease subunit [Bacteroidales bacterium]
MNKSEIFKMGGKIDNKTHVALSILGIIGFVLTWWLASSFSKPQILPSPYRVLVAFKEILFEPHTYFNVWYSVKLNLSGYFIALLITIPFGFFISLYPVGRGLFSSNINAARYLPLTAVTGLFIAWFGIKFDMKSYFMGFSILIYLLPAMIQRVDETERIHLQIIHTLGASTWQKFKYVYFPSTMSKFWKDVRLLTAISWTYIIVAELINKEGGVGAMIFNAGKQSRIDVIIAVLFLIIIIGMLQDILFNFSHKLMFPYDYNIYRKVKEVKLVLVPVNPSEIAKPVTVEKKGLLQRWGLLK